jgi:hypothetical protein
MDQRGRLEAAKAAVLCRYDLRGLLRWAKFLQLRYVGCYCEVVSEPVK